MDDSLLKNLNPDSILYKIVKQAIKNTREKKKNEEDYNYQDNPNDAYRIHCNDWGSD